MALLTEISIHLQLENTVIINETGETHDVRLLRANDPIIFCSCSIIK